MPIVGSIVLPHSPAIIPGVGCGAPEVVSACRAAAQLVRRWSPDVLIVASPHAAANSDYFHIASGARASGDLSAFGAPQIALETEYDHRLGDAISRWARADNLMAGSLGGNGRALDYGTLVPLYFLREAGVSCPILRIGLCDLAPLDHYRFGMSIAKAVSKLDRRAVFVASANLAHRRDAVGQEFDRMVTGALSSGDFLQLLTVEHDVQVRAKECGLRPLWVMSGALDGLAVQPELLCCDSSAGVGHGVATFAVTGGDEARCFAQKCEAAEWERLARRKASEDPWVRLARLSLETYVRGDRKRKLDALPEGLPDEMTRRSAGVFVVLYIHGRLRGCVGTLHPTQKNVALEIVEEAVAAGSRDPRFPPVREDELDSLEYAVDVLGEFEPVSSPAELDVNRYGVVVSKGLRQGVMLPRSSLVDSVELQIATALHRAGIDAHEPYTMQRFEVTRHI